MLFYPIEENPRDQVVIRDTFRFLLVNGSPEV